MATCMVDDGQTKRIYCPKMNAMKQISSLHLTVHNTEDQTRIFLNCHNNPNLMSFLSCSSKELNETKVNGSCSSQAVTQHANQSSLMTLVRPNTFLDSNEFRPSFRACHSHPSPSSNFRLQIDENSDEPHQFSAIVAEKFPPTKRFRSQTFTNLWISNKTELNLPLSTSHLISASDLACQIQSNCEIVIFDCGSPLRQSQNRIRNAILLQVSDKISRKRLKSNTKKEVLLQIKQMNQVNFIVLYDDSMSLSGRCQNQIDLSEKNLQISVGIKCICEEIQNCLPQGHPPILILNSSFNEFFNIYPHLCESLEVHSLPSTPISDTEEQLTSRSTVPPHTAPVLFHSNNDEDLSCYPMTHITHGIFIGSEYDAKNFEKLNSENIEYVLNVTSHVPLYHDQKLHYCRLSADDTSKQNLIGHFDQAYAFIMRAIENRGKVLVHCVAGISRSPAIVISFLMRYSQMNMNDAYDLVKRKRCIVAPNLNFMGQLSQYEKKLHENH